MNNMIPNRIYRVAGTNKLWVYIGNGFGFHSLCEKELPDAPCWWEGDIKFVDTGKNIKSQWKDI